MEGRRELKGTYLISPVAVGNPGKRTFFLVIGEDRDWLRVWLEKQDLQAFALGIRQLLFNLDQNFVTSLTQVRKIPKQVPSGLPKAELDLIELELAGKITK